MTIDVVAETAVAARKPEASPIALSWGAIIAGAVGVIVSTIILLILGSGVGLTMVSPWANSGASGEAIGIYAGVGLIVVQWISSGFGGFLAGRLRGKWDYVHADETTFRDTAHGFLAWALATLVGVLAFASITTSAITGAGKVVASGTSEAARAAAASADESSGPAYFVDSLYRSGNPAALGQTDPRPETARILARSLHDGHVVLSEPDRAYLAQLVAARTGADQAAAQSRVDTVVGQINEASDQARAAADVARKKAAQFSIITALSMLIGAFIAAAAGALGGVFRDEI